MNFADAQQCPDRFRRRSYSSILPIDGMERFRSNKTWCCYNVSSRGSKPIRSSYFAVVHISGSVVSPSSSLVFSNSSLAILLPVPSSWDTVCLPSFDFVDADLGRCLVLDICRDSSTILSGFWSVHCNTDSKSGDESSRRGIDTRLHSFIRYVCHRT